MLVVCVHRFKAGEPSLLHRLREAWPTTSFVPHGDHNFPLSCSLDFVSTNLAFTLGQKLAALSSTLPLGRNAFTSCAPSCQAIGIILLRRVITIIVVI
jgi:hypothetical protein